MDFDYVIVGAGSAGCVLAARLSEDPNVKVALIEAGGSDRKLEVRMPAGFSKLFKTPCDWDYSTTKQAELAGRELYWPRGRMLGGTSSMNAQMWVRGTALDYDQWDLPGWSYDEVLPYFRRAERRAGSNHGDVYGTDGPITISELRSPNVITAAFLAACEEIGLTRLAEVNGHTNEGYGTTPVTQLRGHRWSAADAYLRPAMNRANLTVLTAAHVHKVLIEDGRAVGVLYGDDLRVRAAREVILSAGAIGSPQLLMLSGVGDPDVLADDLIDLVHPSPQVGANLMDHLVTGAFYQCPQPVTLSGAESLPNLLNFLFRRRGMLTTSVAEAIAFIRTSPAEPAPDIELVFVPGPFVDHGLTKPSGHGITVGAVLLQPESRGRITVRDGQAVIDPAYLTAEADLRRLVAGLKMAKRVAAATALQPYAGAPMEPYWGPESDEELARWIRERAETIYHPVGTCRMGADEDSVVDPELRVRGVAGLRVVDASIMPTLNRGHTHAPTVMIAERAADLLKAAS
ncbi:GMC family oxidoreductase N-terminal domain-containing protein [Acrocarpospora macrocephala]|uniref:Putative GMC-type oxidoreductase n=1 Tax=Acrocarpospora macrocephala TaxID=150177 RepID=A0A5M3X1A7_9ACTN|nr:GMC family oxidoreductase N-terminal domain-containing protein [Acrocarpospora macrocephala]GES15495.1 putative GMC-type oxidoreductase [Acrocarpospora macrocephala]